MNAKRYTLLLALLIGLLALSGCARAELTPIVIRITATPQPRTPTPVPPTATEVPPAEDSSNTEAEPTEEMVEEPTQEAAATEVEGVDVKFNFITPLSTIEELDPILQVVDGFDGVISSSGTAVSITVTYDPGVTDVETLIDQMTRAGHPVEVSE